MKKITKLLFVISILSSIVIAQENYKPLFRIYENGLYGFIDSTGQVIIPPKYKAAGEFSEGLAPVRENGYYGYIDESGKYVFPPIYDFCEPFDQGLGKVFLNGKVNFIDKAGVNLMDFIYNDATNFENGISIVSQSYRTQGAINRTGKLILDTVYERIKSRTEGVVIASHYDRVQHLAFYTAVDSNGVTIVPLGKYTHIKPFVNGFAHVLWYINNINSLQNYAEGYINKQGELIYKKEPVLGFDLSKEVSAESTFIEEKYDFELFSNGAMAQGIGVKYLKNLKGEIVKYLDSNLSYEFVNGKYVVNDTNGLYRYIDNQGEPYGARFFYFPERNKSMPSYTSLYNFRGETDPKKERKYGVVDTTLNFLVEPFFENFHFSGIKDGYFLFGKYLTDENDNYIPIGNETNLSKIGICTINGTIIHEPAFEYADYRGYVNGLILVIENGKPSYYNKQGKCVWVQQSPKKNLTKLDIDYRIESSVRNSYYSYNHIENKKIDELDNIDYDEKDISLVLTNEKTDFLNNYEGISLYLINELDFQVSAPSVDGALYLVLQAKDNNGIWRSIENYPSSSCGMSYVDTKIDPMQYWKYSVPKYSGGVKTSIRAELQIKGKGNDLIKLHSNESPGYINPAQFWRTAYYSPSANLLEK